MCLGNVTQKWRPTRRDCHLRLHALSYRLSSDACTSAMLDTSMPAVWALLRMLSAWTTFPSLHRRRSKHRH